MTYIVVSENEIVKAEMERPDRNIYDENGNLFWTWEDYLLSLPRIAAPGHKWKVWDEVEQYKDFHIGWQIRWTVDSEWRNSDVFDYYNRTDENLRRIIAIPIQPTPEGEKVFGEWQLCPKCNGDGNLARYNSPSIISTDASLRCDVCNGAKILARPLLNNDNTQTK